MHTAAKEALTLGVFLAAILASNYALSGLPNVKLFDLFVFVAGYSLGLRRGALVAIVGWFVYGQSNPWGYAQPSLLVTLMGSEVGYALAGALLARILPPGRVRLGPSIGWLGFAAAGLTATVVFDLVTNIYTGFFWAGVAGSADIASWVRLSLFHPASLAFAAIHLSSNVIFFTAFGPPLTRAVDSAQTRWGR